MDELPGIAIVGASGRMGQTLIKMINASDKARLAGVTERAGHDWVGKDLGSCMGGAASGVTVSDDPLEVFARAQAVIDFTTPKATLEHAALAAQARLVHVIGTTGFTDQQKEMLSTAATEIPIVFAPNFSVGVNLCLKLLDMADM